jgi:hypothetical protein
LISPDSIDRPQAALHDLEERLEPVRVLGG